MPFITNLDCIPPKPFSLRSEKDKLATYVKRAQKNFKPRSSTDFSTLPTELLQIILRHVASRTPEGPPISTDLFKARLVSKTFSRAVVEVFASLVAHGDVGAKCACKYADYTILHLPPKSGTLSRVANAFSKADKIISAMVTEVVYSVTCSPTGEVDEEELHQYYCDIMDGEAFECDCEDVGDCDSCDLSVLADRNITTFERQRRVQDKFANQLAGEKGSRLLKKLFSSLGNLKEVQIDAKDYWDVSLVYIEQAGSYNEDESIERVVYEQALPTIVGCLATASQISTLRLKRLGSAAFSELFPLKITRLGQTGNFLQNLANLDLSMTHRDDMDWEEVSCDVVHTPLRAADRVNTILNYASGLKTLALGCSIYVHYVDGDMGDSTWLRDVLYGLTFPLLTTFELRFFSVSNKALQTLRAFLLRHKDTLTRVVLERMSMEVEARLSLLELLRDNLSLSSASVVVGASSCVHTPEKWRKVVEAHGIALCEGSSFVDIGSYVVQASESTLAIRDVGSKHAEH